MPGCRTEPRQLVTIVGGGDVGYRLAQSLRARARCPAPDHRAQRRQRGEKCSPRRCKDVLVINGRWHRSRSFSSPRSIGRSDVMVSVIDNDERNLLGQPARATARGRARSSRASAGRPTFGCSNGSGIDVALSARGAAVASVVHRDRRGPDQPARSYSRRGRPRSSSWSCRPRYPATSMRDLGLAGSESPSWGPSSGTTTCVVPGGQRSRPGRRPPPSVLHRGGRRHGCAIRLRGRSTGSTPTTTTYASVDTSSASLAASSGSSVWHFSPRAAVSPCSTATPIRARRVSRRGGGVAISPSASC